MTEGNQPAEEKLGAATAPVNSNKSAFQKSRQGVCCGGKSRRAEAEVWGNDVCRLAADTPDGLSTPQ